jgi:signal transduction histidine kinase
MKTTNIRDYWNARCSAMLFAIAALPVLSLTWLSTDQPHRLAVAAGLDGLIRGPSAMVATICLYSAWRISGLRQLAWLAAITSIFAMQAAFTAGLQLSHVDRSFTHSLWMVPFDFLTVVAVARFSMAAAQRSAAGNPILIGSGIGLAFGIGRVVCALTLPSVSAAAFGRPLLLIAFVLVVAPSALLLARVPDVPRWASGRLAATVVLYGIGHLSAFLAGATHTVTSSVVTLATDLAGAVLLSIAGVGLLRVAIVAGNAARDELQLRVDELEAVRRRDRARIHEINSTIAGLASASRLLREDHTIGEARRQMLENMLAAELGRLQRLLGERPGTTSCGAEVDLDTTIRNLVLAHEARGNRVSWLPSGARVAGEPDAVAEVLNILLDNAAKHGHSDTSVTVQMVADAIEVAVADDGPGVSPEVRSRLFEWGARGPRSSGQGIGLHIAQDLTRQHGGRLILRDDTARGATFVARFPRARRGDDEPAHLA